MMFVKGLLRMIGYSYCRMREAVDVAEGGTGAGWWVWRPSHGTSLGDWLAMAANSRSPRMETKVPCSGIVVRGSTIANCTAAEAVGSQLAGPRYSKRALAGNRLFAAAAVVVEVVDIAGNRWRCCCR